MVLFGLVWLGLVWCVAVKFGMEEFGMIWVSFVGRNWFGLYEIGVQFGLVSRDEFGR